MRHVFRWLGWIVAALVALPVLAVAVLLAALNTVPGQREATALVNRFAGGTLAISGLSGRFPDALRVARIELRDAQGPYLDVRDAALDWSPLALLHGDALVRRLAAAEVDMARLPVASGGPAATSSGGPASLPVRVDVDTLEVARLSLAAPVAGAAAAMRVAGSAHLADLQTGEADLTLRRLDAPGTYHAAGRIDRAALSVQVQADEPSQGFIAALAKLPGLGALSVQASVDGPWSDAATKLAVVAGPMRLAGQGTVNVAGRQADLDLTASAPAMAPRPDLSWQSVALDAHVHGPFAKPKARATLRIAELAAAGAAIHGLSADVAGDAGAVTLTASAEGLLVPGPKPDLLAAAPLTLRADADLAAPGRKVRFTLAHPLLTLTGDAATEGDITARAHLDMADLAPLAAIGSVDLQGRAALDLTAAMAGGTTTATLDGTINLTGGLAPAAALIGTEGRIGLSAALHGADVAVSRLQVDGRKLTLVAHGGMTGGALDLDWQAGLPDLSVLAATVQGHVQGHGHVSGRTDDLAAQAELTGEVASAGVPRGPIRVTLDARGLPGAPSGRVAAQGTLDGAPLALDATAERAANGALTVDIGRADWKTAHAEGALTLPPNARLPVGRLALRMERLDDLRALLGRPLTGSVAATAEMTQDAGRPAARVQAELRGAGIIGTATVGQAKLDATVRDPTTDPDVAASLDVSGLRAGAIGGTARLTASGRQAALGLRLQAGLQGIGGADLRADAAATLDAPASRVALSSLAATWKGETLRLLAPAQIGFGGAVAVDRLRLGLRQAVLELAGRLSPTLDMTASLRNVTADLARIVAPDLQADGVVNAEAKLTGSPARPAGTARLTATGLHIRTGPGAGLPAANLTADAKLAGTTADVQARLAAGRNRMELSGTAPIDPAAAMRLRAQGTLDLAMLNPLLAGSGRRVLGQATLDATVIGTPAAPRAEGSLRLANGDVQDFALGAHVSDMAALIEATGDTIRISRFSARAGQGTIGARGTVGLADPMPVDLELTARNATPLSSDQLTATLDAALSLRGALRGALAAAGTVKIDGAEIRIPAKLPASVPVLKVRRPGQPPPPPPAPGPDIALDVTVTAPGQVFVRGRGLFAEVAGRIKVGGTAAAPLPVGTFRLRRGEFNLAGTTLTFTSGDVHFEGSGKLDPALNLIASSTNGNITATLTVGGFASKPTITLSSVPPLPQDEVLAQLLFHQSASTLGPLQLASAAAALAQVSGLGGGALDPLNSVRQGLGLDRLTVGGNSTGAAVEAGRYVARGIYVGAKQAASGQGTQATVQIDLLRGLKLETAVGTGTQTSATGAAATTDPYGTSVGLTYQFQY